MPAKRTYKVRVAKDFIVLAGIFFFLCLWAVKDAWYPSDKVLKKHPRLVEVSFETSGLLGQVHAEVGDSIGEGQLLAKLRSTRMEVELTEGKKEYTEAKSKHALMQEALHDAEKSGVSAQEITELQNSETQAKTAMDAALQRVGKIRSSIDSAELVAPTKGKIAEVRVVSHGQIDAGQTAFVINPQDHFYLFNQSLAIFSFVSFWVFLGLHLLTQ